MCIRDRSVLAYICNCINDTTIGFSWNELIFPGKPLDATRRESDIEHFTYREVPIRTQVSMYVKKQATLVKDPAYEMMK